MRFGRSDGADEAATPLSVPGSSPRVPELAVMSTEKAKSAHARSGASRALLLAPPAAYAFEAEGLLSERASITMIDSSFSRRNSLRIWRTRFSSCAA